MARTVEIFVVFWQCFVLIRGQTCTGLTGLNIDPNSISVSGFSGGAAMATQYHVAYSASVIGAGMFAGPGPYYCAESSPTFALRRCMANPANIPVDTLKNFTNEFAAEATIDDPSNLAGDRVYIFHGTGDDTVDPMASSKIDEYYAAFGAVSVLVDSLAAGHGQPTVNEGSLCSSSAGPYINRCDYDGAYEALNHIYGENLSRPNRSGNVQSPPGEMRKFDQDQFAPGLGGAGNISLAADGYLYVPKACQDCDTVCKLHIAFHGCRQNYGSINDAYINDAGYNEVGELNNIVILYPQTTRSFTKPFNPFGCFDWWGYNDPALNVTYPTQEGYQMQAVKQMADCLVAGMN